VCLGKAEIVFRKIHKAFGLPFSMRDMVSVDSLQGRVGGTIGPLRTRGRLYLRRRSMVQINAFQGGARVPSELQESNNEDSRSRSSPHHSFDSYIRTGTPETTSV